MISALILIYLGKPPLGHTIKKTWYFRLLIQRYAQFRFFIKGSGTSFSTKLCAWFFKKNIVQVIYVIYWLPNSIVWLPLLLVILGNMSIVIICCPVCNVINFEIKLSLSNCNWTRTQNLLVCKWTLNQMSIFGFYQATFLYDQKGQDKHLNNLRTKRAFNMK